MSPGDALPLVLLVDDHTDGREMFAEMLLRSGFIVVEAENGDQALARLKEQCPSIVVTDLRMPGLPAVELCRQLHKHGIPVIALTALYPGPEHEAARAAGCAAVLMKPVLPDVLVTEIRRILEIV
jgi:CheY-like chemotaxis protein